MSALKLKVLISGAGIAGPCLSYWLTKTRHDISITIVERSPFPRVTGQAIDIHGAAIQIVKKMDLLDAVRSHSTTEEGTRFLNSSGKPFADFSAGDAFTAEYEILRADLSRLFQEATQGLSNVQYIYGDYITALEQTEKNVNVTFAGGSRNTFDLVVAADGATSKTRSMILDESILQNSYNFLGMYNAFFSIPSQACDPKLWQIYSLRKGLGVMIRPHRNTSTMGAYLSITLPKHGIQDPTVEDVMDKGIEAKKQLLREYFQNTGWQSERILDGMDQTEDFYMSRAAQVKLPKWTSGRALVIGDAAFATFGVGTTLAIQSSYFLAGELSKIQSTDDIPDALVRYEEVFRPVYKTMEDLPPGFPQAMFPQTGWGLWIRDCVLWIVSTLRIYRLFQQGGSRVEFELPSYDWVGLSEETKK